MSEELSRYEEEMLEIEREKLEVLKKLRKDMKHSERMENLHRLIEEFDIDREDVVSFVRFLRDRFGEAKEEAEDRNAGERLKDAVSTVLSRLNIEVVRGEKDDG